MEAATGGTPLRVVTLTNRQSGVYTNQRTMYYSQGAFIHKALGHLGPSQLRDYFCHFSSWQHHSSRPINASKLRFLIYKKMNSGFNRSWLWKMRDSEETIYLERQQKRELLLEVQEKVTFCLGSHRDLRGLSEAARLSFVQKQPGHRNISGLLSLLVLRELYF